MHTKLSSFIDRLAAPHWLIGASVFRVIAGCTIVLQYVLNYDQRHYLFGPEGVYPFDAFLTLAPAHRFSLYRLSPSPLFFELVFHTGLLLAIVWTLGLRTRWLTPLVWLFWMSLHERIASIWDGGDNLTSILLLYACFANLSAHLTIESRRPASGGSRQDLRNTITGLFHNAAMLATAVQVCMVYVVAGLTKVQGESWRNGTALYEALAGGEYAWVGHTDWIYRNAIVVTLLSYVTVAFQISFPFLLLMNRWTRILTVAAAIAFHVGIIIFLTLWTFGAFLIGADLALLGDDEYRRVGHGIRRLARWSQTHAERLRAICVKIMRTPPTHGF